MLSPALTMARTRAARLIGAGGGESEEDDFGTNTRAAMHYSWSQHQKAGGERRPGAHRKEDAVGVRGGDAGGEGGDAGTERSGGGG